MSRGFRDEDVTQAMTDKAMADTVSRVLEQEAEQEARSADRRQHGEAGSCEDCGRPIDPARLAALPEVAVCRECQERRERGQAA